jgi:hypothetical protein
MSTIRYTLTFEDASSVTCAIDTERDAGTQDTRSAPAWTRLEHHQCSHCPLSAAQHSHCPAAVDIAEVVARFQDVPSHKAVHVRADMLERSHSRQTDLQTALHSVLGLMMATGGCPVLSRMKGPARLHMPFATVDETLFRMVGAHFIGQYLQARQGAEPDWSLRSLAELYEAVQTVNRHLKMRLDAMAGSDAHLNAIVSLMSMSMLVSFSLDHELANMQAYALAGAPKA